MALRLPQSLRGELQRPWGAVFKEGLEDLASVLDPNRLVTVGDVTTETLLQLGVTAKVQVVDARVMRLPRSPPPDVPATTLRVSNPPGQITLEAVEAVKRALSEPGTFRIMVEGEEDLLALPAFNHAPDGWIVAYGQPGEGLVLVCVQGSVRTRAQEILKAMEPATNL